MDVYAWQRAFLAGFVVFGTLGIVLVLLNVLHEKRSGRNLGFKHPSSTVMRILFLVAGISFIMAIMIKPLLSSV